MSYCDHLFIINEIFIVQFADRNVIFIDVVVVVQFVSFSHDYHLLRSTLYP